MFLTLNFKFMFTECSKKLKLTVKQCRNLSYCFCVHSLIGYTLSDKLFLSHFGIQGHNSIYEHPQAKMVHPAHPRSLIRAFAAQIHHIRTRNNKKGYDTQCTASTQCSDYPIETEILSQTLKNQPTNCYEAYHAFTNAVYQEVSLISRKLTARSWNT